MNYLHTHPRRLVAALLLVGGMGLVLALTHSARSANTDGSSSTGYTVSYYHHGTLLGSTTVASGSSLDVVWANGTCSNHYGSPPAAFTWSGTSTGVTSAPVIGPCSHAPGVTALTAQNDIWCHDVGNPPKRECFWTNRNPGGRETPSFIANPGGGTVGNLYLYGRTALYAYAITPGKPNKRISVPHGADTIQFAPAP